MKISIRDLRFAYPGGVEALRGLNLTIDPGETVALVGENGAGKSTLARHLNGLLKPSSGVVEVGGRRTDTLSAATLSRDVGYVFQNPEDQLFAGKVRDEVAFGPRNLGLTGDALSQRVEQALALVGLEDHGDAHPYDLQASQRKLLALAATLAMEPPVVVLDEPTTGQDARTAGKVGGIVDRLGGKGKTIVIISHDIEFCAEHCTRFVVLSEGRILADGPAAQVLVRGELLAEAAVDAPQLVRLGRTLGLPELSADPDGFLEVYARERGKGDAD